VAASSSSSADPEVFVINMLSSTSTERVRLQSAVDGATLHLSSASSAAAASAGIIAMTNVADDVANIGYDITHMRPIEVVALTSNQPFQWLMDGRYLRMAFDSASGTRRLRLSESDAAAEGRFELRLMAAAAAAADADATTIVDPLAVVPAGAVDDLSVQYGQLIRVKQLVEPARYMSAGFETSQEVRWSPVATPLVVESALLGQQHRGPVRVGDMVTLRDPHSQRRFWSAGGGAFMFTNASTPLRVGGIAGSDVTEQTAISLFSAGSMQLGSDGPNTLVLTSDVMRIRLVQLQKVRADDEVMLAEQQQQLQQQASLQVYFNSRVRIRDNTTGLFLSNVCTRRQQVALESCAPAAECADVSSSDDECNDCCCTDDIGCCHCQNQHHHHHHHHHHQADAAAAECCCTGAPAPAPAPATATMLTTQTTRQLYWSPHASDFWVRRTASTVEQDQLAGRGPLHHVQPFYLQSVRDPTRWVRSFGEQAIVDNPAAPLMAIDDDAHNAVTDKSVFLLHLGNRLLARRPRAPCDDAGDSDDDDDCSTAAAAAEEEAIVDFQNPANCCMVVVEQNAAKEARVCIPIAPPLPPAADAKLAITGGSVVRIVGVHPKSIQGRYVTFDVTASSQLKWGCAPVDFTVATRLQGNSVAYGERFRLLWGNTNGHLVSPSGGGPLTLRSAATSTTSNAVAAEFFAGRLSQFEDVAGAYNSEGAALAGAELLNCHQFYLRALDGAFVSRGVAGGGGGGGMEVLSQSQYQNAAVVRLELVHGGAPAQHDIEADTQDDMEVAASTAAAMPVVDVHYGDYVTIQQCGGSCPVLAQTTPEFVHSNVEWSDTGRCMVLQIRDILGGVQAYRQLQVGDQVRFWLDELTDDCNNSGSSQLLTSMSSAGGQVVLQNGLVGESIWQLLASSASSMMMVGDSVRSDSCVVLQAMPSATAVLWNDGSGDALTTAVLADATPVQLRVDRAGRAMHPPAAPADLRVRQNHRLVLRNVATQRFVRRLMSGALVCDACDFSQAQVLVVHELQDENAEFTNVQLRDPLLTATLSVRHTTPGELQHGGEPVELRRVSESSTLTRFTLSFQYNGDAFWNYGEHFVVATEPDRHVSESPADRQLRSMLAMTHAPTYYEAVFVAAP
jgi:hypothetical protein